MKRRSVFPALIHRSLLAEMLACAGLLLLSAFAQSTSGQTAVPAPIPKVTTVATGESKTKLDSALSPETRQSLQEAMNSMVVPAATATASVGPGEGAVLDGTKIESVPFASLPAPVKDALTGGVRQTLSGK